MKGLLRNKKEIDMLIEIRSEKNLERVKSILKRFKLNYSIKHLYSDDFFIKISKQKL
jgi:hypothetical protein